MVGCLQTGRLVGGRLFVTNLRIVFKPLLWERLLRGSDAMFLLDDVVAVSIAPPETIPANLRSVLRIQLRSGDDKLFECNGLHKLAEGLSYAIGRDLMVEERLPRACLDSPSKGRRGLEVFMPIMSAGLVVAAVYTSSVIAWAVAAVGLLWCGALLRLRLAAARRKL
jgi:hypothetical protein